MTSKYRFAVEIRPQEIVAWVQVYGGTQEEAEKYAAGRQIKRHHAAAVRIVDRMAV